MSLVGHVLMGVLVRLFRDGHGLDVLGERVLGVLHDVHPVLDALLELAHVLLDPVHVGVHALDQSHGGRHLVDGVAIELLVVLRQVGVDHPRVPLKLGTVLGRLVVHGAVLGHELLAFELVVVCDRLLEGPSCACRVNKVLLHCFLINNYNTPKCYYFELILTSV